MCDVFVTLLATDRTAPPAAPNQVAGDKSDRDRGERAAHAVCDPCGQGGEVATGEVATCT